MIRASVLLLTLAGCGQVEYITPEVPPELLEPVAVEVPQIETAGDLAEAYLRTRAGLATANGRIVAVGCILLGEDCDGDG